MRHARLPLAGLLSALLLTGGCTAIVDPSQIEPDGDGTVAPTVQSTSPAAGATAVAATSAIELVFSSAMDKASVEAAFVATPAIACAWSWSNGDTIATCSPAAALVADTTYALTLSASARDENGAPLAAPYAFSFTTGPVDASPPTVSGTSPADLAQGVLPATAIAVTFSEPVTQASAQGAFSIQAPSGHDAGTFTWSADGRTMTFQPAAPFAAGDTVAVRITTAVTDLAGNAMALQVEFSFQVAQTATVTLYATTSLDGVVWSTPLVVTGNTSLYAGDNDVGANGRAFLSFDLGQLPASVTEIVSATLGVFQENGAQLGSPYTDLGVLHAERVDYGASLDASDLDLAALDAASPVLSSDANVGWKTVEVAPSVEAAWAARATLGNRAQFRLRFATNTDGDASGDTARFCSSEGVDKPYLTIQYLSP